VFFLKFAAFNKHRFMKAALVLKKKAETESLPDISIAHLPASPEIS